MTDKNPYAQDVVTALQLVGQTTIGWNDVEMLWYLIFTCLMHETPRDKTDVIFSEFQTGATQRNLIIAVADPALKSHPHLRTRIGQLCAKTNDLSGMRNAAIHGIYRFDPLNGPPHVQVAPMGVGSKKPNRLAGKHLHDELTTLLVSISVLIKELEEFRLTLLEGYLPKK